MPCWRFILSDSYSPNGSEEAAPQPSIKETDERREGIQASDAKIENGENDIEKHEKSAEDIESIKRAINKNEFLSNILSDNQKQQIAEAMFPEDVRENETVIKEGDKGSEMYVSSSGIYAIIINGKKKGTFSDHRVFGELAILYKAKRLATIKAVTKGKIWVIHRNVYQKILVQNAMEYEDELISFLKKVPNVNKMSEEKLKIITQIFKNEFFTTDTVIVKEGDVGDKFYIVYAGKVTVIKEDSGKVADLGRGEFFGEKALLQDNDKRQATVTAQPPGVECLTITREQFLKYFDSNVFEDSLNDSSQSQKIIFNHVPLEKDFEKLNIDDFIRHSTLGVGGFGRVELVQHKTNKNLVFALKYLKKVDIAQQNQIVHAYNEKDIQIKCNSIFIVRLYKTFKDNKYLYFLMEACLGGDLWTFLNKQKGRKVTDAAAKFYTGCVIEAFSYLHEHQCVYRDLKPENLLIDNRGYLKLTDFGFAKSIGTRNTYTFAGTPEYVAPEIIYNRGHDRAADYWALGIFIFELLAGKTPFKSNDPSHMKTYQLIIRGISHVNFPKHMSNYSVEIVRKLCRPIPPDRLGYSKNGMNDIRKHRWLDGFEWEKLRTKKLKPPFVPKLINNLDTRHFDHYKEDDDIPPDDLDVWDKNF